MIEKKTRLTAEDVEIVNRLKGTRTDREIYMAGLGVKVEPLPRGRPKSKSMDELTSDWMDRAAKQRAEDAAKVSEQFKSQDEAVVKARAKLDAVFEEADAKRRGEG